MSSSLAEQLKRLAVPQTSSIIRGKKRASLLFDPSEAASLTKETIYQIGLDGFEELKSRNASFFKFQSTLFHPASKDFERSIQTSETNIRLNKNIRKFLILLSPYFLMNCSHKTLEWLIYRYHIHEYNKEDLLSLILPYHETNIFVRVLQLLKIKSPSDKWNWLYPLQKPGIHLSKQQLFNHASSDSYLIKFIGEFVLSATNLHEKPSLLVTIFNFYCTTFIGAIEYAKKVQESHISFMLPVLLKGVSSNVPDFLASSLVIITRLVVKTFLSEKLLNSFVKRIIKIDNLKNEALLTLLIIYQKQTHYQNLPEKVLKEIASKSWLPNVLNDFNNAGYNIYPLMKVILQKTFNNILISDESDLYADFINNIFSQTKWNEDLIKISMNILLECINLNINLSDKTQNWIKNFIMMIERQYPCFYDEFVVEMMNNSTKFSKKQQKSFRKVMKCIMKDSFGLYEKLYHPNPNSRIEAIKHLVKNLDDLQEREKNLIKSVIIDRLDDEVVNVVSETLSLFKEKLLEIIGEEEYKNVMFKLICKCQLQKETWWRISHVIFDVFLLHTDKFDLQEFFVILPFLLPTAADEMKIAEKIINSEYAKKCDCIKDIVKKLKNTKSHVTFSEITLNALESWGASLDFKSVIKTLNDFPNEHRNTLHKYVASLVLSHAMQKNTPWDISCLLLEIFESYSETCNIKINDNTKGSIASYILMARDGHFPLEGFLSCVEKVVLKTKKPDKKFGLVDYTEDIEENKFFLKLFKMLLKGCYLKNKNVMALYRKILEAFVIRFCVDLNSRIDFFLNVAVSFNNIFDSDIQLMCLKTARTILLEQPNIELEKLLDFQSLVVPYLLVCLTKSSHEFRIDSMKILKIFQNTKHGSDNFSLFVHAILEGEREIKLDNEQVPLIVCNILSEESKKYKKVEDILFNICSSSKFPIYLSSAVLKMLTFINDIDKYNQTAELAIEIFENNNKSEFSVPESEIIYGNILKFDENVSEKISIDSKPYTMINLAIKNDQTTLNLEKVKKSSPAAMFLNQVDDKTFEKLKPDVKKNLLSLIIKLITYSQNPDVLQAGHRTFKKIYLDGCLIVDFLVKMKEVQSPKFNESKKKRRIGIIPTVDILNTLQWKEGITVLEIFQEKKKLYNYSKLLPLFFELLKKCLDFDEQSNVEYAKQLILSNILHFCKKIETDREKIPENAFNMELVVQCIRASQNPQTHHHALLLLSYAASIIPDQVLHHIIAVFTFVGSSVLRHDDAYSFQIISKIINTIVPLLIKDNFSPSIAKVLRVFVDAILDIPEHRRMPLFKQLLSRLELDNSLHLLLLLIFEAHVMHGHIEKSKAKGNRLLTEAGNVQKRLDIATDVCLMFDPKTLIDTCIKLMDYLRNLPDDTEENMSLEDEHFAIDIDHFNAKQFRHYKYTLVVFVSHLLSSKEFVDKVASLPDKELLQLEDIYKNAIVITLTYIQHISKVADKNFNTPQAQYWKVMLHHCYDILDGLNALLTPQMFLLVIRGLMEHSITVIRRRNLELLNTKLQHNVEFFKDCDESELQAVIPSLLNIIKIIEDEDKIQPDQELLIQTALLSLKLLVRLLAPKDPEKFLYILGFVTDLVKSPKIQENVLASVVLCLAELCSNLHAHSISSLNKFMPALTKILKQQKTKEMPTLLLLSVLTALQKIINSLALFLSPYLEKLLGEISILAAKWSTTTTNEKLVPFINKVTDITHKIGTTIPSRVLIPVVSNCYETLIAKGKYKALGPLMNIFAENLGQLQGYNLLSHLQDLITFFLNSLQFRARGDVVHTDANEVETFLVKALITLVLKLSESSFRPFYYKLYDWAVRTDVKNERVITFYHISYKMASCLKGLFVLFAGHFLNNAAHLLDTCNDVKQKEFYFEEEENNILLVENILKTLNSVFTYDSQKFINKERFDVLMQPIVDQLENTIGGVDALEKRAKEILNPCIVHFVVAIGDDALWKQLNYQIMLKTRHNLPKIRLVALDCFLQVVRRVGEDFLPLLPETIPFLAELLEDDEELVEKTCRKVVQEVEKIVGEPLQKYF